MGVAHPRVLAISLAAAALVGGGAGLAYGLFTEVSLAYGVATGLFLIGLVALAMGLLGAAEPPAGWATRRRSRPPERRSVAARMAGDVGVVDRVTSAGLVVWALVVGGVPLGLSLLIFARVA